MKADDWQAMYKLLQDYGLLSRPFDVTRAYTMQFLEEIYRGASR
jgi:hypothetical protein